ncbi:MAG: DUF721 domain-containing protein [Kiritimatiellae bacterium]|nr:DUF721 domain-containing protein [Kiritimatiellia bacterium]
MFPKRKKAVRRAFPEPVAPEVTDESPFVDTEPEPEMFYAHASPEGRKTLTERDLARNAGVDRLFSLTRRGLPIDADPHETHADPIPMSNAVETLLSRLGIHESPWLERLSQAWAEIVPEEVARDAVPGKWDDERGILFVYVPNARRLFELRQNYLAKIEAAVRAFAPEIKLRQVRLMQNV